MATLIYDSVRVGDVLVVALSRHGGASTGEFTSLNLANYVGDDPASVARNISLVGAQVDSSEVCVMQGEHGNTVHLVTQSGYAQKGDGLVTNVPGLALLALSADCATFALVDPTAEVIAVGHAGWKGVALDVMTSVADKFLAMGGNPKAATAVIGPSICGHCYEVPKERSAELRNVSPESVLDETHIEVGAGVESALVNLGFGVHRMPGCNFEDENLFSYRRAAGSKTGRGGLIVALPVRKV